MTQQQPILFTMRIEIANWGNLKRAGGELFGDGFNEIAGAKPEGWKDVAWSLSVARSF